MRGASVWPVAGLVILLLVSLALMSRATEGSAQFSQLYLLLLTVNSLGLGCLLGLILWNLVRMSRQVAAGEPGARLTARMVMTFTLLSVTPVLIVYAFSLQFLQQGISSWFDVRIEQALEDALTLGQTSLDGQMREALKQTARIAADLASAPAESYASRLGDALSVSGAAELTLVSSKGAVLAASGDGIAFVPNRPDEAVLLQLRQSRSYIGLDPIGDEGLFVRAAVEVPVPGALPAKRLFLQALYPIDERMNSLAESIQKSFAKYRELVYLREPLTATFILTLSLVLAFSLLSAVWAAFFFGRRLVAPMQSMATATRAVAAGDYERQLPSQGNDELGFLVASFNDMTRRLAWARDETRHSQQQVEAQRTYLQAVLARLSSGVITTDARHQLFTANKMAGQILGVDLEAELGAPLDRIVNRHGHLVQLTTLLDTHADDTTPDWREEIILLGPNGRQILVCRGTSLRDIGTGADEAGHGQLIVFDDLTRLIEAQRNQAWSEVARRLAHEIKNPLTPIQLSAERLRHKYLAVMDETQAATFDRLTRTIVQQVEAMKEMVNAFSSYARTPELAPRQLGLNQLVRDVAELYRAGSTEVKVTLEETLPEIYADPDRLRQVLHNLFKNAAEANTESPARIGVETSTVHRSSRPSVQLSVTDNGGGIEPELLERLFEPYVSSKPKGTGLGLAIVKKIVEEHNGVVWAENPAAGGARLVVQLPATVTTPKHGRLRDATTGG